MSRTLFFVVVSLPVLALSACTQFPDLDHTRTAELDRAEYPALVPIEPILARNAGPATNGAQIEAGLNARLASLRARANRMRGSILTGAEKQRLENGLR